MAASRQMKAENKSVIVKPSSRHKTFARTAPITEAKPPNAQAQVSKLFSVVQKHLTPNTKGMPMKKHRGARARSSSTVLFSKVVLSRQKKFCWRKITNNSPKLVTNSGVKKWAQPGNSLNSLSENKLPSPENKRKTNSIKDIA